MDVDTWWQLNLQGEYEIHAVEINRQRSKDQTKLINHPQRNNSYVCWAGLSIFFHFLVDWCVFRMFDIHISNNEDDFLTHGSRLCAQNVTAGPAELTVIKCVQPLRGQYITIQNLAHIGSEPYPADYVKCLYICEVRAFAKGK